MQTVQVEVDTSTFVVNCPCKWCNEMGRSCYCAYALIIKQNLAPNDPWWFHKRYHLAKYSASYASVPPDLSTIGRFNVEELLPPDHKRTSGRPRQLRRCGSCGGDGHHSSTCQNPSTEYRYNQHRNRALKWARQEEAIFVSLLATAPAEDQSNDVCDQHRDNP